MKPILFSTPMVQAILAGNKTQTRRIVKPQPIIDENNGRVFDGKYRRSPFDIHNWKEPFVEQFCKYSVGDILWVRETFIDLQKTPVVGAGSEKYTGLKCWYRADNTREMEVAGNYKPSIFMPKEACRIFLEITKIRVERLQDISEQDAIAEGIEKFNSALKSADGKYYDYSQKHMTHTVADRLVDTAIKSYQSLWEKINGKDSWDLNPYVWVIEFKRINKPNN